MNRFDESCDSEIECVLKKISQEFQDTPSENILHFTKSIASDSGYFNDWMTKQKDYVMKLFSDCFPDKADVQNKKGIGRFYSAFQQYLSCKDFENESFNVLQHYHCDEKGPEIQFLTSTVFDIQRECFMKLSEQLKCVKLNPIKQISNTLSPCARGKVRYVGGYVIAKLKYRTALKIRNLLFVPGKEIELEKMQQHLQILNSLCICYDELKDITNDPESLEEIKRKQNDRESLTNITDEVYDFFVKLENRSRQNLNHENLINHGKHLHSYVQTEIKADIELYEFWLLCFSTRLEFPSTEMDMIDNTMTEISNVLQAIVTKCESHVELYNSVIDLFLCVSLSQFRRDYLAYIRQEKGKALRKKIMEKSKCKVKKFDLQFCRDD
jgi:hypothetical protein